MSDALHSLLNIPTPFNMIVLVILIGSTAKLISAFATQIRHFAIHRTEMNFKRELVERGLSVDEIERVVAAKSASSKNDS
jgi:hypothetical protein